jgi:hypothetical protein
MWHSLRKGSKILLLLLLLLLLSWLYSPMRTFASLMDFSPSSLFNNRSDFRSHSLGFLPVDLSGVGSSAPRPTPNLEDKVSIFISPRDWVAQLYPQAPSIHFSRLLLHAWVQTLIRIYSLLKSEWLTAKSKLILYKALIRSKMTYASLGICSGQPCVETAAPAE